MSLVQCPACLEILEDCSEPCWCVFTSPDVDALGFVHTPIRIPVDQNVLQMHMDAIEAERQLAWAALKASQYDEVDEHAWEMYAQAR